MGVAHLSNMKTGFHTLISNPGIYIYIYIYICVCVCVCVYSTYVSKCVGGGFCIFRFLNIDLFVNRFLDAAAGSFAYTNREDNYLFEPCASPNIIPTRKHTSRFSPISLLPIQNALCRSRNIS